MAQYGRMINSGYDPSKKDLYESFTAYFNDPVMTKLKDVDKYSLYVCKIKAFLGIEYRYIMAFVFKDVHPVGTTRKLSDFQWVSLQTRTLKDNHTLANHEYIPTRLASLDKKITLASKNENGYTYNVSSLPITVTLLPTKKGVIEYNASGSVVTALETYQTIITLK